MAITNVAVMIDDPAVDISLHACRASHLVEQGTVTQIKIGSIDLTAYAGYGCPPVLLAARLRELADEIDAAAAAMTPNQGTNGETVHTEGEAHRPAPAVDVCDGADSHDVGGVPVETVPVLRGDGPGAGPVTAPTGMCSNCGHDDHHGHGCNGEADGDWCACSWPDPGNFTTPPSTFSGYTLDDVQLGYTLPDEVGA